MCLYIKYINHPDGKPCISTRDIHCYKIYFIGESSPTKQYLLSPYRSERVLSTTITAKPFFQSISESGIIDYAIHAYYSIFNTRFALITFHQNNPRYKIFTMCIPKGTKYWIGENGEIAAEKMVFVTDISQYLSKKKKK